MLILPFFKKGRPKIQMFCTKQSGIIFTFVQIIKVNILLVPPLGIEPRLVDLQSTVLPLNYGGEMRSPRLELWSRYFRSTGAYPYTMIPRATCGI